MCGGMSWRPYIVRRHGNDKSLGLERLLLRIVLNASAGSQRCPRLPYEIARNSVES